MTPEKLDAIEARDVPDAPYGDPTIFFTEMDKDMLITALREAMAEVERQRAMWQALDTAVRKVTDERDDAQRLNRLVLDQRDRIEAVLDRANRLLRYALHLRMNGERAPGGNETWRQFDRDCDEYLRAIEKGSP